MDRGAAALPRSGLAGRSPFVGREREISTLCERLEAAARGEGGVVLVSGEPGIGKSRLLLEIEARAQATGWLVLSGRSYDTEGMPPYLAFAEAIAQYLRTAADEEAGPRLAEAAPEVALLVPELRDHVPAAGAHPALGPEAARYRLFEAVSDFFLRLSGTSEATGLLLCLDDLHWADRSTLLLFQHLARKLRDARFLVVAAFRTEEVDRSRPLFDVLAELAREQQDQRLTLSRLSPKETGALVASLSGGTPVAALVQAIHDQTEGNPFFVQEVVRHLQSQEHGLAGAEVRTGDWGLSQGVHEVIGRRVSRLEVETQRLLESAAVLGDGFDAEMLRAMDGSEVATVTRALDEAVQAGMLREEGSSYVFGHPLVRQVIYERLSLSRKQALHLQAVEAMEATFRRNLEPHIAALAAHCRLAGAGADSEKAIAYSLRAGEAALAVLANEEARAHWLGALALLEATGGEQKRRAQLLERIGRLWMWREAIGYLEASLKLYEEMGDSDRAAGVHAALGARLSGIGDWADLNRAIVHFKAAALVLDQGPPRPSQVTLYRSLANAALGSERKQDALDASWRAMEIADQLGTPELWPLSASIHANALLASGRFSEARALLQRSAEVAERTNQPEEVIRTMSWRGLASRDVLDPVDAKAWFRRAVGDPHVAKHEQWRETLVRNLGVACVASGDLEEARQLLAGVGADPLFHLALAPHVAFADGHWSRARDLWSEVKNQAHVSGNRWDEAWGALLLGRLYRVLGDGKEAEHLLEEAVAIFADQDSPPEVWARTDLALSFAATGRPGEARAHLGRCHEIVANGEDWRGLVGRIALAEAAVAAAEGNTAEAEPLFEQAIGVFRRYTLPWDEAEALHLWGKALLRNRRRGAAFEKLAAAVEIYQRHGAGDAWIDRVETDRRNFEGTNHARPSYPGGLTAREVEVLRLIAQGKSNREIGAELVLSLRTVERHMVNIYGKLDIHSKAQATAYAFRHELAPPPPA